MQVQSRADLEAEIAAEEAALAAAEAQQVQAEETEEEAQEAETEETTNEQAEGAEPSAEASEDDELEWLKTDSTEEKKPGDLVPLAAHLEAKTRLKGKVAERDARIAELEAKLAQAPQAQQADDLEPILEQWEFEGDPRDYPRYVAQVNARNALKLQEGERRQQAQAKAYADFTAKVATELDNHYDRAASLVSSGQIAEDRFKAAESRVINTLESFNPGKGKNTLEYLISELGAGSEKVIYNIGNSEEAMRGLEAALANDPLKTGYKAFGYLVSLRDKFQSKPATKPKPVPQPDKPLRGSAPSVSSYRKAYERAHANGDAEKAFDIKQLAKAKGENTSQW